MIKHLPRASHVATAARLLVVLLLFVAASGREAQAAPDALTQQQRLEIAAEALQAYEEGLLQRDQDSARARQRFREAHRRAEQLRADGADTAMIRLLEGNGHFYLGDPGRAIAAYRAGLVLGGGERKALRSNLTAARAAVRTPVPVTAVQGVLRGWQDFATSRPILLPLAMLLGAWTVLWTAPFVRSRGVRWGAVALATVIGVASGAVTATALMDGVFGEPGVLVGDTIDVRQGAGEMFDPVYEQALSGGIEVRLGDVRGEWREVRLPDAARGWVPHHAVVAIE